MEDHVDDFRARQPDGLEPEPRTLSLGRDAQYCQHKPPQPGIAKNGGGQNARATGGPGILPATRDAIPWPKWTVLGETPNAGSLTRSRIFCGGSGEINH